MVSSRQGKSISKAAGSRSLRRRLDLDCSSDQLHLVDSWAVEVTQSPLQKRLWLVSWWGLKIWEPTSGLQSSPPAGPASSPAGALSPPVNSPSQALWLHPRCVPRYCHQVPNHCCDQEVSIYNVFQPSWSFAAVCDSYHPYCLLVNMTRFPPKKSTRVYTN